ncbi:nidogen-2-like [Halichondria panicea]|uniref:nidogen-2-like n=1 Tax=Halichondria panicea TaxID=6063 RepID=UPI00312B6852
MSSLEPRRMNIGASLQLLYSSVAMILTDESFSTTEYLSPGSLCFLDDNLGVVERNFTDCAVPNGLYLLRACITTVDCGSLTNPTNGQVDTSNGTTLGSTAIYNCSTGFTLNGNSSRTCGSDGQWSGFQPTCEVLDPCQSNPCDVNATCTRNSVSNSNFTCACNLGLVGDGFTCETPGPCHSNPCDVNAVCTRDSVLNFNFTSACNSGFMGDGFTCDILASGSGSGELACKCNRSVECSIEGKLTGQSEATVTGMDLKCTIMFSNEGIDTGSGSNFVIDESFLTTEYLSSGSLCFLDNLGVVEKNCTDCAVPNGLPVQSIRPLMFTYIREDGSFGSGNVTSDNMNQQFAFGVGFDLETPYDIHVDSRGLDNENQCSLDNLLQWLSTQPPPLYTAECREGLDGESTDIFFIVECPNMGG